MSTSKRSGGMQDNGSAKRVRRECSYGTSCYRLNPAHFREFSHPHLEGILAAWGGEGDFPIPEQFALQRALLTDQLTVLLEKKLYQPPTATAGDAKVGRAAGGGDVGAEPPRDPQQQRPPEQQQRQSGQQQRPPEQQQRQSGQQQRPPEQQPRQSGQQQQQQQCEQRPQSGGSAPGLSARITDSTYRPVVAPTRRAEDYLPVVAPRGRMAAKHAAAAPYHLFYSTISAAPDTHHQPTSITFLELLDASLGELQSSLQINFMVEPGWLLAQYYFAGYSAKRLTILYGEECDDMRQLQAKPHVQAVRVHMATPFGKHHTKLMLLCYEDGALRVVVSTANLYADDWHNRTQGMWVSARCGPLAAGAAAGEGESPTGFKRSLLDYLAHYRQPALAPYVERVQRCDFSDVKVFLVASVPGSHAGAAWGLRRAGALLRQHCAVPAAEHSLWPLTAQASSLGSYGAAPELWLTGDFLHQLTRSRDAPPPLAAPPPLHLIYPSLENVKQSHDGLLGGGCLPYAAAAHAKQPWLNSFLHQWRARRSGRERAMPHVKSYLRQRGGRVAFLLLTSANASKAAWGSVTRRDAALRVLSYEAGVLLLPTLLLGTDAFPLAHLPLPYDLPAEPYAPGMTPWLQDYLR